MPQRVESARAKLRDSDMFKKDVCENISHTTMFDKFHTKISTI